MPELMPVAKQMTAEEFITMLRQMAENSDVQVFVSTMSGDDPQAVAGSDQYVCYTGKYVCVVAVRR